MRSLATVGEPRRALPAFREARGATWPIERHSFRPLAAIGQGRLPPAALAA